MSHDTPSSKPVCTITSADIQELRELYERGLCLQAYQKAQAFGSFASWSDTPALLMAGRLAANLGAPRLGRKLHFRAYRHDRECAEAQYYFALGVYDSRGPLSVWNLLKQWGDPTEAAARTRSDLFALRARAAGGLRDFETAEQWLDRAEKLHPNQAWHWVEKCHLLEAEDRYEEALDAARRSLELHPYGSYRPGVQATAHVLQLLNRDREALDFLLQAVEQIENGPLLLQMAALQVELGLYAEARQTYENFVHFAPLLDDEMRKWLDVQRCRISYFCGDFAQSAEFARAIGDEFHNKLGERLSQPRGETRRVQLPVHFVRQHYKTCAPATVAAIGRFWKMPADHLALAEAICYDGTPSHKQRAWAEEHGWMVREFRLSWEGAVALIDRGVPFTLATVDTANAHLQAVIGYDAMRKTFILRDPYERYASEAIAEAFLEKYRAHGPHAMVLVPEGRPSLLEGVELLDGPLYDKLYQLECALEAHDRDAAARLLAELVKESPGHALTLQARRRLGVYDSNHSEILSSVEELLKLFPREGNLHLSKLSLLRDAPREERLKYLQEICSGKHPDPFFWQQYACELSADARETTRATQMLRRSMRYRPVDANSFSIYGDILWAQRRFEEACELYRFASCLEDKREHFARAFFGSSRHLKQTEAALTWLEHRFNRFAAFSPQPAFTLFTALSQLEQTPRAFEVLNRALQVRQRDGELLRFAADAHARWGKIDQAEKLLTESRELCSQAAWLRTAAVIADYRGDRQQALNLWRQVLESDPLALDAHRAVAETLGQTEGTAAAVAHLKTVCERFPHHFPLHQLYLDWLRSDRSETMESVLRHLVEINSSDAWTRRELANLLADLRRFDEALAECAIACELDPQSPYTYCTRGRVLVMAGRPEEAKADYRQAIRLSVDVTFAISSVVELCQSHSERKAALQFVEQELIRQVVFGDGLLAFRDLAHPVLEPEELLASLRVALKERPDLWHAHSAVVQQLTEMGRHEEALLCAREATARFPLLPRLWLDLARIHQARHHHSAEVQALEQALQINAGWSHAVRLLAGAYQRDGQLKRAAEILQNAVALDPLNALNHGSLADVLWHLGEKETAIDQAQRAILLQPGYDWPWRAIREWSAQLKKPELAVALARDLSQRRGGEALSWLRLAEMLNGPEDLQECLDALDKAVALNPRCEPAWDLRALSLAKANRWDEALAACRPAVWKTPPVLLRSRAAWIQRQRGCLPEAIAEMRALLKENPDNYWCWRELADWLWDSGSFEEAREAALKLTRLAPMDAVPFGYLGHIKARMGDRVGAKADFRRALELDPKYNFAGFSLFDLQLEDDDFRAAMETLHILRKQGSSDWVRAREAQLSLRRGEITSAMNILREFCLSPGVDSGALHFVADKAIRARRLADVHKTIRDALADPNVHPYAGTLLVECRRISGKWWYRRELNKLQKSGKAGEEAVIAYVSALGDAVNARRSKRALFSPPYFASSLLRSVLSRHSSWMKQNDRAWGNLGYALFCFGKAAEARRWLGDWRGRKQAEPWMLSNLVVVLHRRGEDVEAAELIHHVLAMPRRDSTRSRFQLWAAIEAGLASDAAQIENFIKGIQERQLPEYDRLLLGLIRILQEFGGSAPPKFGKAHREPLRRFLRSHLNDKSMLRVFYRTARFIAQRSGSRWPILWAYSQQYLPVIFGIAIAIGIIVAKLAM